MALDNWYAAEGPIIQRLKQRIPEFVLVDSASRLFADLNATITPAAAFVAPLDDSQDGNAARGQAIKIVQTWEIVLCVPHMLDPGALMTTADYAGTWKWRIARALLGWKPHPQLAQLVFAGEQPKPEFNIPGRAEFPIHFQTYFSIDSN